MLVFVVSDSLNPGDAMVRCHLYLPGVVQRSKGVSVWACNSKRQHKFIFFAREGIGFKLGALIAGGEKGREDFTRTKMYFFFLLKVFL